MSSKLEAAHLDAYDLVARVAGRIWTNPEARRRAWRVATHIWEMRNAECGVRSTKSRPVALIETKQAVNA